MSAANQQARALAFLRIAVGLLFLIFAQYKLVSAQFIHHGMASYIAGFIENGCYPFMQPFLRNIILPHAVFFGAVVAVTELLIALSLIIGVLVRWASLGGLLMMLLYLFSANYPGANVPLWRYFGASLEHSVFALCFFTFLVGRPDAAWAIRLGRSSRHRRWETRLRRPDHASASRRTVSRVASRCFPAPNRTKAGCCRIAGRNPWRRREGF
jgi:uncharacterized membrane protein YphA (DoxX/SURF4 family)